MATTFSDTLVRRRPRDMPADIQSVPVQAERHPNAAFLARLVLGTALMALGLLTIAGLCACLLVARDVPGALANAGLRFAFADNLIRRDFLETTAFEALVLWALVFLALLWQRTATLRHASNQFLGGQHGK